MPRLIAATPILRIFDVAMAREFYIGFLGFQVTFEHRFGENFPLYMGIDFGGGCALHLSEHFGDATPGGHVRIEVEGVVEYVKGLHAKDYRFAKPGLPERQDWGSAEVTLTDPFGNRLTFWENMPA